MPFSYVNSVLVFTKEVPKDFISLRQRFTRKILRPCPVGTLEERCFTYMVQFFEEYMTLYNSSSTDLNLKAFDFLQKRYSMDLMENLNFSCDVEKGKSLLSFLINPHLLELRLAKKLIPHQNTIIQRLEAIGWGISSITVERNWNEEVLRTMVSWTPNVTELNLSRTKASDVLLRSVSRHCRRLRLLNMEFTNITDVGVAYLYTEVATGDLRPNTSMNELYIRGTKVGADALLGLLKYLPNLSLLDHENFFTALCKSHLLHILSGSQSEAKKFNVTHVYRYNLVDGDIIVELPGEPNRRYKEKDAFLICSQLCPHVNVLTVTNLEDPSSLTSCSEFKQLYHVGMYSTKIDYSPFVEARGASLVDMNLFGGNLSIEILIRCCQSLKILKLASITFIDFSQEFRHGHWWMPNLEYLTLEGVDFSVLNQECIIYLLNVCMNLEELNLTSFELDDEQFVSSVLGSVCMRSLRRLRFKFTNVTPALKLSFQQAAPHLDELNVDNGEAGM